MQIQGSCSEAKQKMLLMEEKQLSEKGQNPNSSLIVSNNVAAKCPKTRTRGNMAFLETGHNTHKCKEALENIKSESWGPFQKEGLPNLELPAF